MGIRGRRMGGLLCDPENYGVSEDISWPVVPGGFFFFFLQAGFAPGRWLYLSAKAGDNRAVPGRVFAGIGLFEYALSKV